jgi:FlaA1/EpsC-like NDP-sugar epimerase
MKKKKDGKLPITNTEMTRFNISLNQGVKMVLFALKNAWGGELYVPKIPSYKILDVAKAVAPECKIKVIGIRPGEKIHEEMITASDSYQTYDLGKYYVILPQNPQWNLNEFIKFFKGKKVKKGFNYSSGNNNEWETVNSLRNLIKKNLYPDFKF